MKQFLICVLCVHALAVLPDGLCQTVLVQQQGTVQGLVKDPSGAVIPNATIIIRTSQGEMQRARTTAYCSYVVHGLPSGTYTVKGSGR